MNKFTMDCAGFEERASAWLDNELDVAEAAAMERHAADCEACRAIAADVRAITARAASLPVLHPSRDLWSGIEARIAAPVIPIGSRGFGSDASAPNGRDHRRVWLRPGLAAAALVLLTAGVTHVVETRIAAHGARQLPLASNPTRTASLQPRDTAATAAAAAAAAAAVPTQTRAQAMPAGAPSGAESARLLASNDAQTPLGEAARITGALAVNNVEASYDGEITRLRAIVDHNRGNLDSSTVLVLEHNLQVIDSAIVQCKRALGRDPGSRYLIESLDNALRSKVELLRTTATMSS